MHEEVKGGSSGWCMDSGKMHGGVCVQPDCPDVEERGVGCNGLQGNSARYD